METLLTILVVLAIIHIATNIYFTFRNKHFQEQYDLLSRQLRESNELRASEAKGYRQIIAERDMTIQSLSSGMQFRLAKDANGNPIVNVDYINKPEDDDEEFEEELKKVESKREDLPDIIV